MAKNLLGNGTTEGHCLQNGIWIVRLIFHKRLMRMMLKIMRKRDKVMRQADVAHDDVRGSSNSV